MELLSWPGASESQTHVLSGFIKSSEVFGLEEPIMVKTISIRKNHKTKLPDSIIAATAIVNNLTLITRNIKDFEKIDELEVINPFSL